VRAGVKLNKLKPPAFPATLRLGVEALVAKATSTSLGRDQPLLAAGRLRLGNLLVRYIAHLSGSSLSLSLSLSLFLSISVSVCFLQAHQFVEGLSGCGLSASCPTLHKGSWSGLLPEFLSGALSVSTLFLDAPARGDETTLAASPSASTQPH
jgi:hypothetical protein